MSGVDGREAAGAALAFAAVVLLSFADGGFFPNAWRSGALAFTCVAGLALLVWGLRRPTRAQALVVGGLAAFALWTALSAAWSLDPDASLLDAQRTALYVAAAAAALVVRGALLAGTLAGVVAVCVYALAERLVHGKPEPPDPFEGTLLHEPLGYANGLGALAALGVALALGLLGRRLVLLAAVLAPLVVTLVLTGSRGALLAALAGAAVAAALARGSVRAARTVVAVAAAALVLVLVLPAGSLADDLEPRIGPRAWYWNVAWGDAAEAPVAGRGAGTFALSWAEEQPVPQSARDAHSLYLETLAELGLVGLALLALALAPPLVASLRRPGVPAAAGAYVAFWLHAGLDWDWELPAVTVTGLLCGCALLLAGDRKKVAPPPSTGGHVPRRNPEELIDETSAPFSPTARDRARDRALPVPRGARDREAGEPESGEPGQADAGDERLSGGRAAPVRQGQGRDLPQGQDDPGCPARRQRAPAPRRLARRLPVA